jgi:hypothetical protein
MARHVTPFAVDYKAVTSSASDIALHIQRDQVRVEHLQKAQVYFMEQRSHMDQVAAIEPLVPLYSAGVAD